MKASDEMKAIGRRIKALREEAGLLQQEVADQLYVRRETVVQWEAGTRDLKTEYTVKLAKLFGETCDYILRGIAAENVEIAEDLGLSDNAIIALQGMNLVCQAERELYSDVAAIDVVNSLLSSASYYRDFWKKFVNDEPFDDETAEDSVDGISSYDEDLFRNLLVYFSAPSFSGQPLFLNAVGELKSSASGGLDDDKVTILASLDPDIIVEMVVLDKATKLIRLQKNIFWDEPERKQQRDSYIKGLLAQ